MILPLADVPPTVGLLDLTQWTTVVVALGILMFAVGLWMGRGAK